MTLLDLITSGWTVTLESSHSQSLPILCTCTRTIDLIAPHIHRRALGTCAGPDIPTAIARAYDLAQTNESEVTTYHLRSEPIEPMPDLLKRLGLTPPPAVTQTIRRI